MSLAAKLAADARALNDELEARVRAPRRDFTDGSQQRQHSSGTVGVHAGIRDGGGAVDPGGTGETGLRRESRSVTASQAESKARVGFPAPGDPSVGTTFRGRSPLPVVDVPEFDWPVFRSWFPFDWAREEAA